MRARAPALLALAACEAPAPADERPAEDTAAMIYEAEDPEPLLSAEQVGEAILAAVALGAPSPAEIAETYAQAMEEGTDRCPGEGTDLYQVEGGCMTEARTLYAGVGWYDVGDEAWVDGAMVEYSFAHGGDFEIRWEDGERFAGGGELEVLSDRLGDDLLSSSIYVAGSWEDTRRADWLGQRLSAVYTAELGVTEAGSALTLTGGFGVGELHLFLDALSWDPAGACAGVATGAVHVRDERGTWSAWELGSDCDACGPVIFHEDQDLGELCLDLAGWGEALVAASTPR